MNGTSIVFLPRHAHGNVYSLSDVLHRANIDALKQLGATQVINMSARVSFDDAVAPSDFVFVDQFIDRTFASEKSFFWHYLRRTCLSCTTHLRTPVHSLFQGGYECRYYGASGGTYMAKEGLQFSTRAENRVYPESSGPM